MATLFTVILLVVGVGLAVCLAYLVCLHRDNKELQNEVAAGRRENSVLLDRVQELEEEKRSFLQRSKKSRKVIVPSFGKPELKIYSPLEYDTPLVCTKCEQMLVVKEDFYEIPVVNDPGSVVAVHLRCEREEKYGN